jgi:hypothetical protein
MKTITLTLAATLMATSTHAATRVKVQCTPIKEIILLNRPNGSDYNTVYPTDNFLIADIYTEKGQRWDFLIGDRNGWAKHSLLICKN